MESPQLWLDFKSVNLSVNFFGKTFVVGGRFDLRFTNFFFHYIMDFQTSRLRKERLFFPVYTTGRHQLWIILSNSCWKVSQMIKKWAEIHRHNGKICKNQFFKFYSSAHGKVFQCLFLKMDFKDLPQRLLLTNILQTKDFFVIILIFYSKMFYETAFPRNRQVITPNVKLRSHLAKD
jgi:hypothetical protein